MVEEAKRGEGGEMGPGNLLRHRHLTRSSFAFYSTLVYPQLITPVEPQQQQKQVPQVKLILSP